MDNRRRIHVLFGIFVFLFLLVSLRLADIQLLRHRFYQQRSQEQRTRLIKLAAQRGDIFDRNGNILATSIDTYSVYRHKVGWFARKKPLAEAEKLIRRDPAGFSLIKEKRRIYPKDRLAAQVLGFVGVDNQGLSGVELAFDEYLRGREGRLVTEGDPRGRELYGALRELEPGRDGMDVTLTIDENVQYVAERAVKQQIRASRASSGLCIVMEAESGDILALASEPAFDPNEYQQSARRRWHPTVLDPYEPGSTFKVITVAVALDEGVIKPEERLKAMDSINIGGKTITNAHEIDWPGRTISLSEMLEQSINTGAAQVGLKLGPERFYKKIRQLGFGERTGFGLWGESKGILKPWQRWYKPDIGMITFGQTIAVTPLQLLAAFSALAGDGRVIKPVLVKKIESTDGKFVKTFAQRPSARALSLRTVMEIRQLLRNVITKGTGRRAAIDGFAVCGKTGTAQKPIRGGIGYHKDRYISSFIGFAPMDHPRVIALVIIDEPQDSIWGEKVAAPVFKEVVEYTLRYLSARPDVI